MRLLRAFGIFRTRRISVLVLACGVILSAAMLIGCARQATSSSPESLAGAPASLTSSTLVQHREKKEQKDSAATASIAGSASDFAPDPAVLLSQQASERASVHVTSSMNSSTNRSASSHATTLSEPGCASTSQSAEAEPLSRSLPAFPPADFVPPFNRSAVAGDGVWVRLGSVQANERAAQDPPIAYRTTVHPHAISKFIKVTIVAMDLRHLMLHWTPGSHDPQLDKLPAEFTPGLVAKHHQDSVVLAHNGGFKPEHGGWGMKVEGIQLVAPRVQGCTIVINGADVKIGSWKELESLALRAPTFRQTPPCLATSGKLHESLLADQLGPWGGTAKNLVTRRRTAIGIDSSGRILYFAMGEEANAKQLGQALLFAGATSAAQLDINWNWTRFLLFGLSDGQLKVTSTLIAQMVHRKQGYVTLSEERDFFYLTRRTVPLRQNSSCNAQ